MDGVKLKGGGGELFSLLRRNTFCGPANFLLFSGCLVKCLESHGGHFYRLARKVKKKQLKKKRKGCAVFVL